MMKLTKTLFDPNGHVAKLIFEDGTSICECVAYKFENRGVVCFSVQSGCPVGCVFCGTGQTFIRNLHANEMLSQIEVAMNWIGHLPNIQIMAMSMGEPMLNMVEVDLCAQYYLKRGHHFFISTVGIKSTFARKTIMELGMVYPKFGLQISLHSPYSEKRTRLLGNYPNLMSIQELENMALEFHTKSGNFAYFNFICHGDETEDTAIRVAEIVGPHHLTCSVLCDTQTLKKATTDHATRFGEMCSKHGTTNWSIFDPAGQDTIGGGCGQLLYVQEFFKQTKEV